MTEQMIETKTYAEQIALRKKKKIKIISIVAFALVFMIALTIILMACIKVDLRPSLIKDPDSIYFNSKTTVQYDETNEKYNKFLDEYDRSFNASFLTALFAGRLGGYDIEENHLTVLPEDVTNGNYVTFLYKNEEDYITLVTSDGKTYYSKYNSNYSIEFSQVTFALSEENKLQDTTLYLKYNWNTTNSGSGKDYYIELKLKANTYNLNELYKEFSK